MCWFLRRSVAHLTSNEQLPHVLAPLRTPLGCAGRAKIAVAQQGANLAWHAGFQCFRRDRRGDCRAGCSPMVREGRRGRGGFMILGGCLIIIRHVTSGARPARAAGCSSADVRSGVGVRRFFRGDPFGRGMDLLAWGSLQRGRSPARTDRPLPKWTFAPCSSERSSARWSASSI